jgi:hypothetical protein
VYRIRTALLGGGTQGNEQITAVSGVILIVLLAALGVTILRIRQLIWPHLFVGCLLLGPLAVKLGSTGYRFTRYYAGSRRYRDKGPPGLALRLLAPLVVASTVVVFLSGLVLMFDGPAQRGRWLLIHKASFIIWLGATALHVLGHLPRLPGQLRGVAELEPGGAVAALEPDGGIARGAAGRWLLIAGSVAAGVILAVALIPHFGTWTAPGAFPHHEH